MVPRPTARGRREIGMRKARHGICAHGLWTLIGAVCLAQTPAASAEPGRFTLELLGGGAWNASTSLRVEQRGQPEVERRVEWRTRPFEEPVYWAARASIARARGAWELQLVHHKLYASDLPSEVQHFEVSHGFNLVTVARAFELGGGATARIGAGVVLAHAESAVRGQTASGEGSLGSGYELTGPVLIAGIGWRHPLSRHLFLAVDAQLSAARARVSIAHGTASFRNYAAHGLAGIGGRFGATERSP
jgi:hypothetical protein